MTRGEDAKRSDATGTKSGARAGSCWVTVGPLEVAEGEIVPLKINEYEFCLARSSGRLHAFRDECSHGQVRLSEGEVRGGFVECWMHGSRFDLKTGVPAGPPAVERIAVFPLRLEGSDVEVMLPAPA